MMSTKRGSKNKRAVRLKVAKKRKTVPGTDKTVDEITGMLSEDMFGRLAQSIGEEAFEEFYLELALRMESRLRADEADPTHPEDETLQFLDEYRLTHPEFTK